MPEYLAPGVYVEEVDTGDKPIEGVSTSTAGMVGLTMRGPVGLPTLVTSVADFTRQFGGRLDYHVFTAERSHLPLAIEGFFANAGKRVYVVRVLPDPASPAAARIFDRGDGPVTWSTSLAGVATRGDSLILVPAPTTPIGAGDWFLIDDPNGAEYQREQPAAVIALSPLVNDVTAGDPVTGHTLTAGAAPTTVVAPGATAGQKTFPVTAVDNLQQNGLVVIGAAPRRDLVRVTQTAAAAGASPATVTVATPLVYDHPAGDQVQPVTEGQPTGTSLAAAEAVPGAWLLAVAGPRGNLPPGGGLGAVAIGAPPAAEWHLVEDGVPLAIGAGLAHNHLAGAAVAVAALTPLAPADRAIIATVAAGAMDLELADVTGIAAGTVLALGPAASPTEYVVVEAAPGGVGPGSVALQTPVRRAYTAGDAGAVAHPLTDATAAGAAVTLLARDAHPDEQALYVTVDHPFQPADVLRIGDAAGAYDYQRLAPGVSIEAVVLGTPLASGHSAGVPVLGRGVIGAVQAVDRGAWGNCLEVTFSDEDAPILDTAPAAARPAGAPDLTLLSTTGIEPGTILEFYSPKITPFTQKVAGKNGNTVQFEPPALLQAVDTTMRVRTREFKMRARCVRLNPRTLQRQTVLGMDETIRQLSTDPRHSRYFVRTIGLVPDHDDERTDGESSLVRVSDPNASDALRVGPDTRTQSLAGGDDAVESVVDDTYLGPDAVDPGDRRGLAALKNVEEISLVSIPGQTSQDVQNGLIVHCEDLRYRFAVLDCKKGETIATVQQQRNLYDTKYAALYYPWAEITDPFPANPRLPTPYAVPPSGHVLGIYARVDDERGVHKAPANEVLRGIDDLEAHLVKEQQDILNPVNINVLRDFRDHSRGLRVWGARCITSDPDWKYVNVRRLFIFLEASLDRGTQWVVFEPNDERTWARVRQSITAFLTDVWHDGALMGQTAEQAFFVKCDRTTMTQADIDNGRLIVVVGVAPVRPAEFVIIRIGQWAGGAMEQEG